jgi:hypothetical protein
MAITGYKRGDFLIHGLGAEDQFGLRWHRLLLNLRDMPAVHLGPVAEADHSPAPQQNHSEPTMTAPLDAESTQVATPDGSGAPASGLGGAAEAPAIADEANPFAGIDQSWHPPFFEAPIAESTGHAPQDGAPPGGFIPKADALVWSGPAIMAIPADMHDAATAAGAAPPANGGTADAGNAASGDAGSTAAGHDLPDGGGTADAAAPPDEANIGLVLTRDDLDPLLTAMGGGAAHSAGDLSGAFQPAGDDHLPLDFGLGAVVTLPPMPPPPPPEVI